MVKACRVVDCVVTTRFYLLIVNLCFVSRHNAYGQTYHRLLLSVMSYKTDNYVDSEYVFRERALIGQSTRASLVS